MADSISGLLADTWWYGLTGRLSPGEFESLARLRAQQGYSALQVVVGIPPEVGPEHPSASSPVGYPWTLEGTINREYLAYARDRVGFLNDLGLRAIIYGAWGHQIDWIGSEGMSSWWARVVDMLDSLDVVYCLSGEINLWIGQSSRLLPDRSTDDLARGSGHSTAHRILPRGAIDTLSRIWSTVYRKKRKKRRDDWDSVLGILSGETQKPILVHPTAEETAFQSIVRPHLLSANTVQTGHDYGSRQRIWQLPTDILGGDRDTPFINLEPWYEGIRDSFWAEDQMYAYWTSMLSGAASYCYGAHGIWNVGDGHFLSHWGGQTYSQAKRLDTPRLLGLSHRQLMRWRQEHGQIDAAVECDEGGLISIRCGGEDGFIAYYPEVSKASSVSQGRVWLPLEGRFSEAIPQTGQVVVLDN